MRNQIQPIMLDSTQLRNQQMILLELLCEVKRICKLADIKYVIIAGTMLGAVRHEGFIPWDDDADIAMFRKEYEAFCAACCKYLDTTRFYFQDHVYTKGYRWGYGKLRRKDSSYVVCGTENLPYEQGIWIDIFPLDYVPDSRAGRLLCNFHCFCIRKLLYAESGKYREKYFIKRMIYAALAKIPLKIVLVHYEKYIKKRNRKETDWVRILMFPTPNREYGYLRKWYRSTAEFTFEKQTFIGVKDYDEYLTFKFGKYSELPPPDKRKRHCVSKLEFPK